MCLNALPVPTAMLTATMLHLYDPVALTWYAGVTAALAVAAA